MKKSNKFSPVVRERAVRTVQDHRGEIQQFFLHVCRHLGGQPLGEKSIKFFGLLH